MASASYSFDDIGQGLDIALGEGRVATTLGRHTSDFITSFYTWTPSGFMVEYGWGARSIDPAKAWAQRNMKLAADVRWRRSLG